METRNQRLFHRFLFDEIIGGCPFARAAEFLPLHNRIVQKVRARRDGFNVYGPWWPNAYVAPDYGMWMDFHPEDPDVKTLESVFADLDQALEALDQARISRRAEADSMGLLSFAVQKARAREGTPVARYEFGEALEWIMEGMVLDKWWSGIDNMGTQWEPPRATGPPVPEGSDHSSDPAWMLVGWAYNTNSTHQTWVRLDTVPPELLPALEWAVQNSGRGIESPYENVRAAVLRLASSATS